MDTIRPSMPVDWSHGRDWEAFYKSNLPELIKRLSPSDFGSIPLDGLTQLANRLISDGSRDVWLPGCGLAATGGLLARLGLHVVVTDVSPTAIEFQRFLTGENDPANFAKGSKKRPGSFRALVHDFREDFGCERFDLIINTKAFQGFPTDDQLLIASVHARALRPGRVAYFDTMNVQGERRDQLEQSLERGGFVVPLHRLNRWYRAELRSTGIPHVFILGRPVVPMTDEYEDKCARQRAMEQLHAITREYQRRLPVEVEAERAGTHAQAKIANVLYSTG